MKSLIVAALSLITLSIHAHASELKPCDATSFSEVGSLNDLPKGVRALLEADRYGREGIADRGARFIMGDVIGPDEKDLPFRRFSLAAVSKNQILVAVEHGGRAHFMEFWVFDSTSNGWHGEQRLPKFRSPPSMEELTASVCA